MTFLPKFKVEISFVSPPLAAAPTFVDVSSDVRLKDGVTIRYGRPDLYSTMQPTTAVFTLDNHTGGYTPGAAGSSMRRGLAVRITATEDGASFYPRAYVFIDSVDVATDDETGLSSYARISCVDLTALLANAPIAKNMITAYTPGVLKDYWPMSDVAGTVQPKNLGSGGQKLALQLPDSTTAAITFGAQGGSPTDGGLTAAVLSNAQYGCGHSATSQYTGITSPTGGFSAGGFFQFTNRGQANTGDDFAVLLIQEPVSSSIIGAVIIYLDFGGVCTIFLDETSIGGTIAVNQQGSIPVLDGRLHHIGWSYSRLGGGTVILTVDGVADITLTGVGASVAASWAWWATASVPQTGGFGDCLLAHVMGLDVAIDWSTLAKAGLNGFSGETSADRITRIAALWNVSPTLVPTIVGSPGTTNMGPLQDIAGAKILDLMTSVMGTENGRLFANRSALGLTLRTRLAQYNQAAALTLANGSVEPGQTFTQDKQNLINDQVATAYGSTNPQEVSDSTSISVNGLLPDQQSLQTLDDFEALAFAQWRVGDGNPKTRSSSIELDLMTQQALVPGLLVAFWQLDLGQRISETGLPASAPASSLSFIVEGIEETLTDVGYDATINTSAAPLAGWKLQDSTLGVLDSTTVLAY